ncbi:hypothetical protein KP79_PYT02983 [Mizuhopecten yessoensis]|uniref:G-protein coupled receptors family 1 profile domain-containing protein n=1 Tax=Mizuhopecten yessoensis TaxID=6573 RepID=A0A210PJP5_MIZYE|nr:hypothetical protein KP79_PYT02983 [Mizuhopecten yessoensis]
MDIYVYILPVFIVTGTIGNVLTMAVYYRKPQRSFSIGLYLFVYSIENTLILFLVYGSSWIAQVTPYPEAENLSDWGCRVAQYTYRMVMHCGIWILVSMTLDRYIYVCHPHRATDFCKVFTSKAALILIVIGVTVVSIHAMWTYELRDGHCLPLLQSLHYVIWNWFSASCLSFVPLLLLFVLDMLLVVGLCTRRSGTDNIGTDLTNTVLGLSLIYLILALPATIVNIIYYIMPGSSFANADFIQGLKHATSVSNFMSCGNQTVIFIVCVTFSSSFRLELKKLILCCRSKNDKTVSSELTLLTTIKDVHVEHLSNDNETRV